MALNKNFSNAVAEVREVKKEVTKLTELPENSKDTIYNLIFGEESNKKSDD